MEVKIRPFMCRRCKKFTEFKQRVDNNIYFQCNKCGSMYIVEQTELYFDVDTR